jgi:hypothetical protein
MSDLQPTTRVELIETGLRSIWEQRGRLVPAEVVDLAADQAHPLHPMFEWSDSEAARRYRIGQATAMIRSVKITVTTARDGETDDFRIRSWVSARAAGEPGPGYLPEEEIRLRPDQRERVLRQMMRELNAFRRRYSHMAEFWSAIEQLGDEGQEETG